VSLKYCVDRDVKPHKPAGGKMRRYGYVDVMQMCGYPNPNPNTNTNTNPNPIFAYLHIRTLPLTLYEPTNQLPC